MDRPPDRAAGFGIGQHPVQLLDHKLAVAFLGFEKQRAVGVTVGADFFDQISAVNFDRLHGVVRLGSAPPVFVHVGISGVLKNELADHQLARPMQRGFDQGSKLAGHFPPAEPETSTDLASSSKISLPSGSKFSFESNLSDNSATLLHAI
jgi:hypothetical protein